MHDENQYYENVCIKLRDYIKKQKEKLAESERIRKELENKDANLYWDNHIHYLKSMIQDLEFIVNSEIDAQNMITEESLKKWRTRIE